MGASYIEITTLDGYVEDVFFVLLARRDRNFRCIFVDRSQLLAEVAAPPGLAVILAIQNKLRRIYERSLIATRNEALSLREQGLRKAILPANVVPVIDVESQRNDLLRTDSTASKSV